MRNVRKGATSTRADARRPARQILTDGAYESLKAMIMDHRVGPGERLNIDELARQLEVSATPVREALARLEADGLVAKRALSGYAAAPLLDIVSLRHLFEIRNLLEPFGAKKAATNATDEEIATLQETLVVMGHDDIGDTYSHYRAFAAHDAEFHGRVIRIARNPVLEQTLAGLRFHWHLYRLRFERAVGLDTVSEHASIVDAIRRRDPSAASSAMRNHLKLSERRLMSVAKDDES